MAPATFKKKVLPCLITMALAGTYAPVYADEGDENKDAEVVEIVGIRDSLKQNLASKRDSNASVDVVVAEDIGKFPDKNVAESLQRISGVTVQRQFGEGAAVSIRGAGVDLTLTTLNGQNVASTGWFVLEPAKRSFNYELLPSELVGELQVYKSSQADLAEGGVGGTIVVKTRKPLDLKSNTIFAGLEYTKQSDSGENDPQLSGLYSWKNDRENFGFLVSLVDQNRHLQRQGNEAFWEWGAGPVGFEQERERSAQTVNLQFAPSDRLDMSLNAMKMKMNADNTNYALWLTQADTSWGSGVTQEWLGGQDLDGDGQLEIDNNGASAGGVNERGTPVKGPLNVAYWQARPREATMKSDVLDFDSTYKGDKLTVHFQLGKTKSSGGTDFEMEIHEAADGTPIDGGSYDFTNGEQTWDLGQGIHVGNNHYGMSDYIPAGLTMSGGAAFNKTPKKDEENYKQVDFDFPVDYGFINSIKTGVKLTHHETSSVQYNFVQKAGFVNTIADASSYYTGTIDVGAGNYSIARFDPDAIKAWARSSIDHADEVLGAHSEIIEDNKSAYVMFTYDREDISGNFGVRYATTDAESIYYHPQTLERSKAKGDYSEFLPSFNLKWMIENNLIFRTSIAKVMARPQYVDMYVNPSAIGANDETANNQFWVVGNVDLDPFTAKQADVGIEYYFSDTSYFSAAVFMKQVDNFVTIKESHANSADIPFTIDPTHTCNTAACESFNGWTVQEKNNGKDADIRGVELQYQQDFGNGFGTLLNYTFTDTSTDRDTFTDKNPFLSDSSKHTYNLSGYFENENFSVRLSYNWRSEYMIRESGAYGNRLHDDFGSLDLSAVYHVNDHLDVKLTANNLTEESSVQKGNNNFYTSRSGFTNGFPLYEYEMARIIALGVSAKF